MSVAEQRITEASKRQVAEEFSAEDEDVVRTTSGGQFAHATHASGLARVRQALQETKERLGTALPALGKHIKAAPRVAVLPLLLLVLLILAGQISLLFAAKQYRQSRHEVAAGLVLAASEQLVFQLQNVLSPVIAMAAMVKREPDVPSLSKQFPQLAADIIDKVDPEGTVTRLILSPWGLVTGVYPLTPINMVALNHSFLDDPSRVTSYLLNIKGGIDYADVIGPLIQLGGTAQVLVCRIGIWLPNVSETDSFGLDKPFPLNVAGANLSIGPAKRPETTACGTLCLPLVVNGTVYRFWGVVYSQLTAQGLTTRLNALGDQGFRYVVVRRVDASINNDGLKTSIFTTAAYDTVVFKSHASLGPQVSDSDEPECQEVDVPELGITWVVCLAPLEGWNPSWLMPLQIVVVITSVLVSGLLFGMLVSQQRHSVLVKLMLPPKVIRYLNLGRTYAEPFQQVTILFSDIVSYTNMSSEMTPCELVELLNSVYSHFDHLVDKHGLYKVETVGDAFMCVGGAPEACSPHDAAVRVARMALDMVDFAKTYAYKDGRNIEIRVGMYTGDVTAAVIGKKMPHWCLVGDAVNMASRMETNSIPMHVHVGNTTAKILRDSSEFQLQARGTIQVKGKGLMSTFFLWSKDQVIPSRIPSLNYQPSFHATRVQQLLQSASQLEFAHESTSGSLEEAPSHQFLITAQSDVHDELQLGMPPETRQPSSRQLLQRSHTGPSSAS